MPPLGGSQWGEMLCGWVAAATVSLANCSVLPAQVGFPGASDGGRAMAVFFIIR